MPTYDPLPFDKLNEADVREEVLKHSRLQALTTG
jgi:hypothetical protein